MVIKSLFSRLSSTLLITILLIAAMMTSVTASATNTAQQIFDPQFKTLKVQVADNFMAPPVIRMGSDDMLIINFDEIGEDFSDLQWRLIHCNADWQPSRLVDSEFIDGFNSGDIGDYAFSTATYVHYVNYRIEIPSPDMRIIHSGNYLLQVFRRDNPEDVILQARFSVVEPMAHIAGGYTTRTDRGHYSDWQQLDFRVDASAAGNLNPYADLIVTIDQNGRSETLRTVPQPARVEGKTLVFSHQPDLIFPASNEYRRFESVSNSFPGMNVDSLRYMGTNYHVWLKPDEERLTRQYAYDRTQHGRFIVREYNSSDSDIGADYITVHFTLDMPEMPGREVYVDGEFSNGLYSDFNRMTYIRAHGRYEAQIPLKQGAYNYQYVTTTSSGIHSTEAIEGNKHETENEYRVAVYLRPAGARADRLIGYASLGPI